MTAAFAYGFDVFLRVQEPSDLTAHMNLVGQFGSVADVRSFFVLAPAAIFLVVEGCLRIPRFPWSTPNLSFTAVVFLTTCVTLSAAFTSYYLFEKRFLQLRNRLGRRSNRGGVLIAKAQST